MAVSVTLLDLSTREFRKAEEALFNKRGTPLFPGADFELAYRNPRILRMAAAGVKPGSLPTLYKEGTGVYLPCIPPILGPAFLAFAWQKLTATAEMREDYQVLAQAFLEDESTRAGSPELQLLAVDRGMMQSDTARKVAGDQRFDRMLTEGLIRILDGPDDRFLIMPAIPELLCAAGAALLAQSGREAVAKESVKLLRELVVDRARAFSLYDLVGARAMELLTRNYPAAVVSLMQEMVKDAPRREFAHGRLEIDSLFPRYRSPQS